MDGQLACSRVRSRNEPNDGLEWDSRSITRGKHRAAQNRRSSSSRLPAVTSRYITAVIARRPSACRKTAPSKVRKIQPHRPWCDKCVDFVEAREYNYFRLTLDSVTLVLCFCRRYFEELVVRSVDMLFNFNFI